MIELIGIAISLTVLAGNGLWAWSQWVKWETRARIAERELVEARKAIKHTESQLDLRDSVLDEIQASISKLRPSGTSSWECSFTTS